MERVVYVYKGGLLNELAENADFTVKMDFGKRLPALSTAIKDFLKRKYIDKDMRVHTDLCDFGFEDPILELSLPLLTARRKNFRGIKSLRVVPVSEVSRFQSP